MATAVVAGPDPRQDLLCEWQGPHTWAAFLLPSSTCSAWESRGRQVEQEEESWQGSNGVLGGCLTHDGLCLVSVSDCFSPAHMAVQLDQGWK